jgi:hypothetical protein
MLAHPEHFGGVVLPIRGPGQESGRLVECYGW